MFEKIMIATDGSRHSQRAAEVGIEVARLYSSEVTALYVVDIAKEYASIGDLTSKVAEEVISSLRASLFQQGEAATGQVEELGRRAGIEVRSRVVEGHPAEVILRLAEEEQFNLLVLGGIGVTGLGRFLLGSVAERVVRSSEVPVLVARADQ